MRNTHKRLYPTKLATYRQTNNAHISPEIGSFISTERSAAAAWKEAIHAFIINNRVKERICIPYGARNKM